MGKKLEISKAGGRTGPRIELDQEDPKAGDVVTFTITQGGSDPDVQLQGGSRVAFGEDIVYDVTQDGDSEFTLGPSTTYVAWLLKRGEPVVGTLFWVTE